MLRSIGDRLAMGATVKNLFGEPVTAGERTVIPIARISYSFGGGGGSQPSETQKTGGGAGGRMSARPWGALEISPGGTRFVGTSSGEAAVALLAAFVLGVLAGTVLHHSD
jgi:uncharacterized spore protein YtfJ